jgi:hypothetical protein
MLSGLSASASASCLGSARRTSDISLTSLAATLLVYDLAVRRSPATRFLFGLKPDRRTPPGMPARRGRHHANADAEPGGG